MIINNAVEKLATIFTGWRATFKNKINDPDFLAYKNEFLIAMVLAGINTQGAIDCGIRRARSEAAKGREFMPSGAMFGGWCKPSAEDYGIESFDSAYPKIIARAWERLHPAFQHLAQETIETRVITKQFKGKGIPATTRKTKVLKYDFFAIRSAGAQAAKRMVKDYYNDVVKKVSGGEVFAPIEAVEDQSEESNPSGVTHTKHDGPTGNEAMRAVLAMMGVRKANG